MEMKLVLLLLVAMGSIVLLGCVQPPLPPEPPANGYIGNNIVSVSPTASPTNIIGGNTNSQAPGDMPPLPPG